MTRCIAITWYNVCSSITDINIMYFITVRTYVHVYQSRQSIQLLILHYAYYCARAYIGTYIVQRVAGGYPNNIVFILSVM